MNDRKNLTRWNRASLTRFRYIDGNAVEYLEILRQQLVRHFVDSNTTESSWLKPAEEIPDNEEELNNETLIQRQERLGRKQERILEMYHQDRRDWGWEISRTFARACHILTEHTNAYANEEYLGTATQWDNVRRLVEMLDYHPAPPASAYTRLAFEAKENKKGTVAKGFKIQHTPETGGPKIIFETLEDIFIDSALNELRPKGWDKSEEPVVPQERTQPSTGERQFSTIANGPVINLQGVGDKWADILDPPNTEPEPDVRVSKIKDFHNLKLDRLSGLGIGETRLREFKAKATALNCFELETGWAGILDWLLIRISSTSPESLAEITGNALDKVQAFQQKIESIGACLDHEVYANVKLKDLIAPGNSRQEKDGDNLPSVRTEWKAKQKPKVVAGQIAMIMRKSKDEAEGATISKVDESRKNIHLLLDQVDYSWTTWLKSEIALHVSPRWKRKCWLNNEEIDVIRTVAPHGFTQGAYVSWQENEKWRYAKVKEADKRTMRLELDGTLPQPGAEIVMSQTFDGDKLPADYQEIALINDDGEDKEPNVKPIKPELVEPDYPENLPKPIFKINKIFPIDKGGGDATSGGSGGGLLPSASLPKIGSFLFPSPMLPMDLVKVAVELLLSLGVMQIPSTGDFVIKGMPFGGMLEGVSTVEEAAKALIELLDNLEMSAKWDTSSKGLVEVIGTPPDDLGATNAAFTPNPIYFELDCVDDQVVSTSWLTTNAKKVVNASGDVQPFADSNTWSCKNGKIVNSSNQPLGYQPLKPADQPDGAFVNIKLTEWDKSNWEDTKSADVNKLTNMEILLADANKNPSILFKQIDKNYPDESGIPGDTVEISGPLLAVPKVPLVKAVVEASEPLYMFDGKPGELENSDWVVGRFTDGLRGLKIHDITDYSDEDSEKFSVSFSNLLGNEGELQKVYADFRGSLIAEGASVNTTEIDSEELELEDVPDSLKTGSEVLLTAEDKDPIVAKIEDIEGNTIITNPSSKGFTKGELIILANVVLAGHGESKPAKILGSGDAAKSNQEFLLEVEKVSFTPDATKSSGVSAAIEVDVAGRVWEQVSTLKDSVPGDYHYAIRMTEEGYVKILFGDGEYGRRLPSSKNNIRVRYRVGSGLSGNVPAGGLEKPVSSHPLIKAVLQPLRAAGGGDMEDMASLRENAPSTLLSLERAVSLSDFSHLAAAQSSAWQAKAYSQVLHGGRTENVKVVIVPADGVQSQDIEDAIGSFLQKHALPGVQVTVDPFESALFDLSVTVRVKTDEFIAEEVEKAVTSALTDHFTLKNRKIGEHLYLSEVYKVVEGVKGVENSNCEIFEQPSEQGELKEKKALQVIKAGDESTVVYLDTGADKNPSTLTVNAEEYLP